MRANRWIPSSRHTFMDFAVWKNDVTGDVVSWRRRPKSSSASLSPVISSYWLVPIIVCERSWCVVMATRVRKQWFCRISLNCFQKFSVWHVGSGSRSTENVITRTSSPYGNREEKKNKFCFTTISCKTKSRILCLLLFGRRADALSEFLNCFQFHSGVVLYVRARRRAARANWFTILNWKRIEPGIMHTPTLGRRRWDTPASYDSSSSSSLNWIRL